MLQVGTRATPLLVHPVLLIGVCTANKKRIGHIEGGQLAFIVLGTIFGSEMLKG